MTEGDDTPSAKAKKSARDRKAAGKVYGKVPYGCVRIGDNIYREPFTWFVRGQIIEWRKSGMSLRKIGGQLEAEKIPTPGRAKLWGVSTIRDLLSTHESLSGLLFVKNKKGNESPYPSDLEREIILLLRRLKPSHERALIEFIRELAAERSDK